MARTRSLKPGFFKNEELARLPYEWRLLFAGLWTQADRVGRLEDRPVRLKAELFPYDDLEVEEGLSRLADGHFITRYDVNGSHYIEIATFLKHQSPHANEADGGFPPPSVATRRALAEHSESTPRALAEPFVPVPGTGTGTGTSTGTPSLRAAFERFWQAYPDVKRTGHDAAWTVWKARKPNAALVATILEALERQKQSPQWREQRGRFIPAPKTWLREGRWKDARAAASVAADQAPRGNGRPTRHASDPHDQVAKTRELERLLADGVPRKEALKRAGFK